MLVKIKCKEFHQHFETPERIGRLGPYVYQKQFPTDNFMKYKMKTNMNKIMKPEI